MPIDDATALFINGSQRVNSHATHDITHVLLDFSFLFLKFGLIVKIRQDEAMGRSSRGCA